MLRIRAACASVVVSAALILGCSDDNPAKPKPAAPITVSFAAAVPISSDGLGGALSDLLVTDLSDDARPDIAVGMIDSSAVWVRFGEGGGSFAAAKAIAAGTHPHAVTAANISGNARNDLIVGGDGALVILQALPGDTFAAPDTMESFPNATVVAVATADFDRDGIVDVAAITLPTAGPPLHLYVFSGATRGPLFSFASYGNVLATGDVNGDQFADIIVSDNLAPGLLGVYVGSGGGSFPSTVSRWVGDYPLAIATANLDLDMSNEIAVGCGDTPGLWMLRWNAGGLAADSTYAPTMAVAAVAAGDLNLDGHADIAASGQTSANVAVLVNNWDGKLQAPRYVPAGDASTRIAIADVTGDGRNDIVVAGPTIAAGIRYLENTSH
jgi:hypothetical protein